MKKNIAKSEGNIPPTYEQISTSVKNLLLKVLVYSDLYIHRLVEAWVAYHFLTLGLKGLLLKLCSLCILDIGVKVISVLSTFMSKKLTY